MDEILRLLDETRRPFVQLAKEAGLSRNTIYNIRQNPGTAKMSTIEALARVLGYRMRFERIRFEREK